MNMEMNLPTRATASYEEMEYSQYVSLFLHKLTPLKQPVQWVPWYWDEPLYGHSQYGEQGTSQADLDEGQQEGHQVGEHLKYICTAQLYSTSVQYICTVYLYSTSVQYICTVYMYSISIQYISTVHLYSTDVRRTF